MKTLNIAVLPGDGIGPEIMTSARRVLDAALGHSSNVSVTYTEEAAGAAHFTATGENISEATLGRLFGDEYDSILKAPAGLPTVRTPDGTEAGGYSGKLRTGMDLYANVRAIRLVPGVESPLRSTPHGIDYVIVRENTEGLYASRRKGVGTDDAMVDTMFMSRRAIERVSRYAFELARRRSGARADGVRRVTCVDKANVLQSFAFFRRVFTEVAQQFPDVEHEFIHSDAAAQELILDPGHYDVLVMENFLGDLFSDLGGGTVGGIGFCPSANIGDGKSYFEPCHGSAPALAGRDLANPTAQILSAALMIEHLGHPDVARRMRRAVDDTMTSRAGLVSADGTVGIGTSALTDLIVDHVSL